MPFCGTCGAPVEGRFCGKCGSPMPAGATEPPSSAAQPVATGMADNVASALCYALGLVTGILFLVLTPYNQNKAIRFHAFQSIFLNIAAILLSFAFSIMIGMFHFVGALFGLFLGPLIWLAFFGLWLYMMFSAYQGKTVVLPIIGPLAQQQA